MKQQVERRETHSYVGATACREAWRPRAEGSSSERSRSRLRPRCPPRSRHPALLLLLLLLRPPWLVRSLPAPGSRSQISLSRAYSRAASTGRREAFLPRATCLRNSLSFYLSFFVVSSSISSHSFARANRDPFEAKRKAARCSEGFTVIPLYRISSLACRMRIFEGRKRLIAVNYLSGTFLYPGRRIGVESTWKRQAIRTMRV